MKAARIASWCFLSLAAILALHSLGVLGWLLWLTARDLSGPSYSHTPGGAPGNIGAAVGGLIWIGSGLLAAVLAYVIALAARPFDEAAAAWRFARRVERTALVGGLAPLLLWGVLFLFF